MSDTVKTDFGPEYLKAEDLLKDGAWQEYSLKIKEVIPGETIKASDGTVIKHPIVLFEKAGKRLILGKLNQRLMKYATGTSVMAEWVGKTITLRACKGNWFGQQGVAAIRLALPKAGAKPFVKKADMGEVLTGQRVDAYFKDLGKEASK